ncbi:Gag protein [Phytophthora palmivora]|uniref:Gag protein n=1 Tax=Phytophthora palmivora TaxID=4796 RepID=A0A2P4XKI0_9STRA|nr:Gag protein [Phytophthora palmivora]
MPSGALAAATPAEQVERNEAFDMYERGLIARVQRLRASVATLNPVKPKPPRLKGKERENLHFWIREVELVMDEALISTERLRVAFALSNLGDRSRLLPANYEYHQRSRFLACTQGKRELHEYIQEMQVLAASLAGRPTGEDLSPHGRSADGARHGGLAPESLGALETRKSSGGLLVVHASVREYGDPFRVLIDSGASTNFARRQTVARNGDKYADALRESKGRGQVSVRLADSTVVNVPGVRMDMAVKFEDFDSTKRSRSLS